MTSQSRGAVSRRPAWALGLVAAVVMAWIGWRHFNDIRHLRIGNTSFVASAAFCWLLFSLAAAWWHRDVVDDRTGAQLASLDGERVTVIVALFQEDPAMFAAMLDSISIQSRQPARLHVVDDGSTSEDCRDEFDLWNRTRRPEALDAEYTWQPNAGKRHAQARAVRADPDADFYVTMDSDVLLANPDSLGNLLLPFTRRRTMSVAGFLIGANPKRGLLYRLIELGFVCSFLNGRATNSALGSVTVNAGGLAAYRSHILLDNMRHYLRQTVAGNRVMSGDDAMLTRYALLRGRTVFQRSAVGLTLHPNKFSHLTRQRIRWARSYWWGSHWFLKHFPVRRIGWWIVVYDMVQTAWMTLVMPVVLWQAAMSGRFGLGLLGIITILAYVQSARFLSVRRPDESFGSQLLTYALAPLASLLQIYLGWALSYVGLATFAKTGWSTRSQVEVGLDSA